MARDRVTELRRVRAGDLEPHPANWRGHPENQQAAMKGILDEVGWSAALVAYEHDGGLRLIDGHLRAGIDPDEEVPVLVLDVDDEEAAKLLVSLDPISAMAQADKEGLRALLDSVQVSDEGLGRMLADLARQAAPPKSEVTGPMVPPVAPKTKMGDMYALGAHRLLCGDATKAEDVAVLMGGEQADMVFTDPPYGVEYTGGAKKREPLEGDHIGTDVYAASLVHLSDAAADHAALYLWYADGHAAAAAAVAAGYVISAQIIWVKNNAQFVSAAHYKGKHEPCFYAHRKGCSARWNGSNNEVTVWDVARNQVNEFHPTQKPLELAVRALQNSSYSGDGVLDLFLGSGTTLLAAEQTDRKCFGMEIDPAYCDVTVARWEAYTGEKAELL